MDITDGCVNPSDNPICLKYSAEMGVFNANSANKSNKYLYLMLFFFGLY